MKKKISLLVIIGVGIANIAQTTPSDKIRPGVVLYKIKKDATANELKSLNALLNSHVLREETVDGINLHIAQLNSKGREQAISKLLRGTGAVKFAEPDMIVSPSNTPNDPDFSNQWHHVTINSTYAWDTITSPEDIQAVKVCVLDTGVDQDHPDLMDNLLPGYNANHLRSVEDFHGHGTGTAGVIGAVGNNAEGISGVLWDVNIIPVQINNKTDDSTAYLSTMAKGIKWCADQGVKVANLSYEGANASTIDDAATYLREHGGLLFMSAGNSGNFYDTSFYPDWKSFIIVGSTNKSDIKSAFSNYGPFIDLVAPGESILTTYLGGKYVYYSGTSFSSPMVAGVGAMIFGLNPNFTPDEVENILLNSVVDLGDPGEDDMYGKGRLDAQKAVDMALEYISTAYQNPVPVASMTYLSDYTPRVVEFDGSSSSDDGTIISYLWDFGDGSGGEGMVLEHTYENPGQYYATLTVRDDQNLSATSEVLTVEVSTDPNFIHAPSALSSSENANSITLSWVDNSENEDGFMIERAKRVKGKYLFTPLSETASNINTFTDTIGEQGTYQYRVKAFNEIESSAYSNVVTVTVKKNNI
ncbi:S8 family serine peptidase [Sulfurovum sp. zt1-1]|uniref:S8 family serine peptidase n=1 Tax=Sulfurovum zhangzhouensis TaxID=3019067 RepID=A0ABT7QW26_9BACT|nr:S8 family serine peptidase [Sulfurovum zhangzhouensis]MDM5271040.1 S8 family serine peptidase [Sulfurovum zhangzhouensis]